MRREGKKGSHPERSRGTPLNVDRHATGFLDFAALRSE
jgi:hypothetical protein